MLFGMTLSARHKRALRLVERKLASFVMTLPFTHAFVMTLDFPTVASYSRSSHTLRCASTSQRWLCRDAHSIAHRILHNHYLWCCAHAFHFRMHLFGL